MISGEKPYILIVTELFPANDQSYTGTFVLDQLKALRRWYNIIVLVPSFPGLLKYLVTPNIYWKRRFDIEVYFIKDSFNGNIFKILQHKISSSQDPHSGLFQIKIGYRNTLLQLAHRLHQKYHFQLVHGHESFIGDEAATIGSSLHIPSVVTIHGLYNLHLESWGTQTMSLIVANLKNASKLLSVSHTAAMSYMPHLLPYKSDITVIPNGIHTQHGTSPSKEMSRWNKKIRNRKIILSVGTLVQYKRFDLLIESAKQVYDSLGDIFALIIIGNGRENQRLKAIVKHYGLSKNIYFVGPVPPKQMSGWYALADFLAHPSVIDSFSMVCLESMAHGKPIICTSAIGIAEYISNQKEGFIIAPNSTADLTLVIKTLLMDDQLRERMGQDAYRRSLDFHWSQLAPKIRDIYESIA